MSDKIELRNQDGVWKYDGTVRKSILTLRSIGYSHKEVGDTIGTMLAMTMDELKEIYDHPNATALEKAVAMTIRKGIEKGSMFNIEMLLSRAYGKPRESIAIAQEVEKKSFSWHSSQD